MYLIHLRHYIKTKVRGDFQYWNALSAEVRLWLNYRGYQVTGTATAQCKSIDLQGAPSVSLILFWKCTRWCLTCHYKQSVGWFPIMCRAYFIKKSVMLPAVTELGKNFYCWYLLHANPVLTMGKSQLLSSQQHYSLTCVCVMYCRHVNQCH